MKSRMRYLPLILLPFLQPNAFTRAQARNVVVQKDVPFVPEGGVDQQMDLYLPPGQDFPLILYLHEGSLTSGERRRGSTSGQTAHDCHGEHGEP